MKNNTFFIDSLGKHSIVRIRIAVASIDINYLQERFSEYLTIETYQSISKRGKRTDMVRIEGCIPFKLRFIPHYHYAKAIAQASAATARLNDASWIHGCNADTIAVHLEGFEPFRASVNLDTDDLPF